MLDPFNQQIIQYYTSHWRRKWQLTPLLLPGKFHGWRSLIGYSPWGHKEFDMIERQHIHHIEANITKSQLIISEIFSGFSFWICKVSNKIYFLISFKFTLFLQSFHLTELRKHIKTQTACQTITVVQIIKMPFNKFYDHSSRVQ